MRLNSLLFSLGLLCAGARAQSSVTLAWDPVTNSPVAGYRLYGGTASQAYTTDLDAGNATQKTVSDLTGGVTYYFAATAYEANGLESVFSTEITYTPPVQELPPLVFSADSGTITAPFIVTDGMLSQTDSTTLADGGRAAYNITIVTPGPYTVSAVVNAPASNSSALYLNMDADPTGDTMIWDVPGLGEFTDQTASWRGTGTQASPQFVPKIFTLTAGTHELILRGADANVQFSSLTISPAYPQLELQVLTGA